MVKDNSLSSACPSCRSRGVHDGLSDLLEAGRGRGAECAAKLPGEMGLIVEAGQVSRLCKVAAIDDFADRGTKSLPRAVTPKWYAHLRSKQMLKAR